MSPNMRDRQEMFVLCCLLILQAYCFKAEWALPILLTQTFCNKQKITKEKGERASIGRVRERMVGVNVKRLGGGGGVA